MKNMKVYFYGFLISYAVLLDDYRVKIVIEMFYVSLDKINEQIIVYLQLVTLILGWIKRK